MTRRKSLWKKIATVLLGLLLVFAILEVGLRVGGFIMLSVQEYGNLQSIKQNGEFRIMCLGESTTQNEYPPYLEEILNKHDLGVKISVIDKGLANTNTVAIMRGLEANLDRYQPDVVVTMMGCNDWMTMYYQEIPEANSWAFKHCRVYRFGRLLYMNFFKRLKKEDVYSEKKEMRKTEAPFVKRGERYEIGKLSGEPQKLGPETSPALVQSGWIYSNQGKFAEAEKAFRQALELKPENNFAYEGLGCLYREQSKYPEAEDMLKKAIELNPQSDSAYTGLGWLYRDQGRYVESESMLHKAVGLNPQNGSAYAELGRLYNCQQRYPEAERALKEAIKINPKQGPAYEVLGVVYRDQRKFVEAEQILNKAVEHNPDYEPAYVGLGHVYKMQQKLAEAEKTFRRAVEINPRNVVAQGGLATVYSEMGNDELSEVHADKLRSLREESYNPVTVDNYRKLKKILAKRKVLLVCAQYPMRGIQPLKNIFPGEDVILVDNEKIFKDAVKREGYDEYFRDIFGGDFGHCTVKGNRLLAENIADVIVREIFGQRDPGR